MVALEDVLESSFKDQSNSPPDDTTDKEVISELLHRFSGLWSQPGVCRKEHVEHAVILCLKWKEMSEQRQRSPNLNSPGAF